jgi:predicted O-methyltransferase YrrM
MSKVEGDGSPAAVETDGYVFTAKWFDAVRHVWDRLFADFKPRRILEVGTYEGASACYVIENAAKAADLELHCIDSWEGGPEHQMEGQFASDMGAVEQRFRRNVARAIANAPHKVELTVHKGRSDVHLARLLGSDKGGYFDLVYIDGSHMAADVLCDAVLGFRLLRIGGIMVLDDYLWAEPLPYGTDPLRCPKPAIDAFINLNIRKLKILRSPLVQVYVRKLTD